MKLFIVNKQMKWTRYNMEMNLVVGLRKFDHITSSLISLHWLPVEQSIIFKLLFLAYESLNGHGLVYLKEMFVLVTSEYSLRSIKKYKYKVSKSPKVSCGDRAFLVIALSTQICEGC